MTGIQGFVARGMWVNGERGHKATGGSGGYPAEWNPVSGGQFEWKGGLDNFLLFGLFFPLLSLSGLILGRWIRLNCRL
jgi:hypothetical protein